MQTLFGFELSTGMRWIIALAIVLALVALFFFVLRRMSGRGLNFKGQGGGRTRQPRLGVVDIHDLDRTRQLVLVRRDNVEHLVMIGGASDVVIETNIMRAGGARVAAPAPTDAERPAAFDPAGLAEPFDEQRRMPPVPDTMPVPPQPVPLPPQTAAPVPPAPVPMQGRPEPVQPPPRQPAPSSSPARPMQTAGVAAAAGMAATIAGGRASAPPASETGELGDMARQLEEALKRPFSAVRPASRGEPSFDAPVPPAPVAPPVQAPPAAPVAPAPVQAKPVRPQPGADKPLDMEAELEMALGLKPAPARPAGAPVFVPPVVAAPERRPVPPAVEPQPPAKPEPAKPDTVNQESAKPETAKPEPAKAPEPASQAFDPLAGFEAELAAGLRRDGLRPGEPRKPETDGFAAKPAAPAAAPKPAETAPKIVEPKIAEPKPADSKPAEQKAPEPKPADAKPLDTKPSESKPAEAKPVDAQAAAEPKGEAPAKLADKPTDAAPAKPDEVDPFSVDAIEAEFARLLGRDLKPKG
ncbi:hypothetical protein ABE438_00930 [Bosea sp. TWI1241]|uniref:hypothetical protein n=1 Tax=Bosea sp. TWI1241 TaxID=3148904 RepID=UPI0032095572